MGLFGIAPAAVAAVAFGVQYVPVKKYKILVRAKTFTLLIYDGTTFQWFMCSGILFVGLAFAILGGDLARGIPPKVVFGGCLWALSNFAVLPLVKLLGIGLGFSLYHFQNMIVGYVVGRKGLFGLPALQPAFDGSLIFCDVECCLILVSFVALLLVEGGGEKESNEKNSENTHPKPTVHGKPCQPDSYEEVPADRPHRLFEESSTFAAFALEIDEGDDGEAFRPELPDVAEVTPEATEPPRKQPWRNCALGVLLAIVAGSLTGVQSVPATLYSLEHPDYPSTAVIFPQCVGVWFASTAIYVIYSGIARLRRKPVLHSVIRPAFISGCIWSVGFLFMIKGIHQLGFAVGYTLVAVGPIIVASLVSICWFKEITGRRQLLIYWSAEALQLLGVILITAFSQQ
ncbi:Transmembrane protein 144-like B [Symbiodinium microadriaticum]|uniref:Transmembrane protein 144-like B n=1 Tax=Symbiodinium microadriaticum TaxID=2951 RepID=A0A1Q9E096_SYMMI|nr:Transmembrane protein 144-like B [Symbiodinium microadriaticum]